MSAVAEEDNEKGEEGGIKRDEDVERKEGKTLTVKEGERENGLDQGADFI